MTLITCASIGNHSIQRVDQHRALLISYTTLVTFTPTEYSVICALLQTTQVVSDISLIKQIYPGQVDRSLSRTFEKHVENVKSKLRGSGIMIRRVYKCGYILLSEDEDVN
jgi:DNA-binding response OmpR family regulator